MNKYMVSGTIGVVGGFITSLFGGWTNDLSTLVCFMVVDFVTGLMVAAVFKKSNKTTTGAMSSQVGFQGLCKKGLTLMFVLIGHRLDVSLGLDYVKTTIIIASIVNELTSIIENAGLMGFPVPKILVNMIDVLKGRSGDNGSKKNASKQK